jgi:hypothetical protein
MITGLYSGAPHATIPIYEIKLGQLKIPVALGYSSSGFKVDEIPSSFGLGWSLSCEGVIRRVVHGLPDVPNLSNRLDVASPLPPLNSIEDVRDYYTNLSSHFWDGEPDEFVVSAPGLSMKFIIDNEGKVMPAEYTNNRVSFQMGPNFTTFTILTDEGITYNFGGQAIEHTTTIQVGPAGSVPYRDVVTTAFFLTSIHLPGGKFVNFQYQGNGVRVFPGVWAMATRGDEQNMFEHCPCDPDASCPGPTVNWLTYKSREVSEVYYLTKHLSRIITSDNQEVIISYQELDQINPEYSTDLRATAITVSAGDYNRDYVLSFTLPSAVDSQDPRSIYNPRYFLTGVKYKADASGLTFLSYSLEYNDFLNLPPRLTFAQDLLGYYNGASNSKFLPPTPQEPHWDLVTATDRGFHGSFAAKGMLEKITYPTGGFEKFWYEPNTIAKEGIVQQTQTPFVDGGGTGQSFHTYYNSPFTVYYDQVHVPFTCTGSGSASTTIFGTADLVNMTTGASINLAGIGNGTNFTSQLDQLPAGQYMLVLRIRGQETYGSASIDYNATDPNNAPIIGWINEEAGGVRVAKIESYDPITENSNFKYYFYAEKQTLGKSSGVAYSRSDFTESSYYRRLCMKSTNPDYEGALPTECDGVPICPPTIKCVTHVLSSNSSLPLYLFDNNHIAYEYVIESDDPAFANGGTQHKFAASVMPNAFQILGYPIPGLPSNTMVSLNGRELETLLFDKSRNAVRQQTMHYKFVGPGQTPVAGEYYRSFDAKTARQKYDFDYCQQLLDRFDAGGYHYTSQFMPVLDEVTTEYAGTQAMSNFHTYVYHNEAEPKHTQPILVSTQNSKGEAISTEYRYAPDMAAIDPGDPFFADMMNDNQLRAVIEVVERKDGQFLKSTRNNLSVFNGVSSLYLPSSIQVKTGSELNPNETRVVFEKYDNAGNLLLASKASDIQTGYIWDYDNRFPVAEIKNAKGRFAYTSFEYIINTGSGNWTNIVSANCLGQYKAPTGRKYLKGPFSLFAEVDPDQWYYASYWSTAPQPAVMVGAAEQNGWPRRLYEVSRDGLVWYLYEHKFTSKKVAKLEGVGYLDELRLYPVGAMMSTVAYSPFVGVITQCDANNRISYYEYDILGRLDMVRDDHNNILKKYCYNYAGLPDACSGH